MSALLSVRNAKLPTVYVQAKEALATCQKIDECKDWADQSAALASYARQAKDDSLRIHATRIQARAIRRCGELLKQIKKDAGRPKKNGGGVPPISTRTAAANAAKLSRDQKRTALRIASIPAADFERAVESDDPPTITELSEAGKKEAANRAYRLSPKPPGFKDATQLLGTLERFSDFCERADPKLVAEALSKREVTRVRRHSDVVTAWIKALRRRIA